MIIPSCDFRPWWFRHVCPAQPTDAWLDWDLGLWRPSQHIKLVAFHCKTMLNLFVGCCFSSKHGELSGWKRQQAWGNIISTLSYLWLQPHTLQIAMHCVPWHLSIRTCLSSLDRITQARLHSTRSLLGHNLVASSPWILHWSFIHGFLINIEENSKWNHSCHWNINLYIIIVNTMW